MKSWQLQAGQLCHFLSLTDLKAFNPLVSFVLQGSKSIVHKPLSYCSESFLDNCTKKFQNCLQEYEVQINVLISSLPLFSCSRLLQHKRLLLSSIHVHSQSYSFADTNINVKSKFYTLADTSINVETEFYSLAGTNMNSMFYSIADTDINVKSQPYFLTPTLMLKVGSTLLLILVLTLRVISTVLLVLTWWACTTALLTLT